MGSLGYDRSLRRKVNIKSEGGGNGLLRGFASRNDEMRAKQGMVRGDPLTFCKAKRGMTEGVYGLPRLTARNDNGGGNGLLRGFASRNDGERGGTMTR